MSWLDEALLPVEEPSREEIEGVRHYAAHKKAFPRFYADENFPPRAIELLRALGLDGARRDHRLQLSTEGL